MGHIFCKGTEQGDTKLNSCLFGGAANDLFKLLCGSAYDL